MGQSKSKDVSHRPASPEHSSKAAKRLLKSKNSKKWRKKHQGYSLPCGLNEIGQSAPSFAHSSPAPAAVKRRSSFQVLDKNDESPSVHLVAYNKKHQFLRGTPVSATSLEVFPDFSNARPESPSEKSLYDPPVLQIADLSTLDPLEDESLIPMCGRNAEMGSRAQVLIDPGLSLESPLSLSVSQPRLSEAPKTTGSSSLFNNNKRIKTLEFIRRRSGVQEEEEDEEDRTFSRSMPNFDVSTRGGLPDDQTHASTSSDSTSSDEDEDEMFPIDEEEVIDYDDVIDQAFNDILKDAEDTLGPLETADTFAKQRLPPLGCSSDENMGEESCYDSLDEDGRLRRAVQAKPKPRRSLPALPKEASNYSSASERALKVLKQKTVSLSHVDNNKILMRRDSLEEQQPESKSPASPNRDSGVQSLESNNFFPATQEGFLWVGLNGGKKEAAAPSRRVERSKSLASCLPRPTNHRHSAPPGSLKDFKSHKKDEPPQKRTGRSVSVSSRRGGASSNKPVTRSASSRIHSAVVTGINGNTKSVTVEWRERDETKGKEIELETLLSLNQDLIPQNNGAVISNNKQPKYSTRSTNNNRNSAASSSTSQTTNVVNNSSGMRNRNKFNSRQTMGIPANNEDSPTNIPVPNNIHASNNGHGSENAPPAPSSRIQQQVNYHSGTTTTSTSAPTATTNNTASTNNGGTSEAAGKAAGGVNRRRSNVVKEVERLKKNREERRAKQAEILEEKEAQKNIDPGNPNWEFLSMIRDYQEQLDFSPLQDGDQITDHQITVCVRKRPLNKKEEKRREVDVVTMPNKDQIIVHEPKTKVDLTKYLDNQHFRYDYAFDDTVTNELVYKYAARPLVQNIFEGGMATCFAYGQTGSGKTHTMGGEFHGKSQDSKNGIYALATTDVFKFLKSPKYKGQKLQVSCSYFEIYSGKVFDLLSGKSKLRVLEDGKQQVVIVGLTEKVVECVEDVLKLITHGNNLRTSGQTSANAHSSRSHAVFQIILRQTKNKLFGKFSLIDLAGNERGADTSSADRQTRMEGAEINKSLLALKECIRALGRKGGHLPFRASKLTQVLRDSFIGEKSKTCMIAMVSPVLSSCEHTLNTLRYADRVKELGANDPVTCPPPKSSSPTELEPEVRMEDGVLSPEDSDLAQLRSLNEGELSADWYNFQEAISHLQILEEELVEGHRASITQMTHWVEEDAALIAVTNGVDYDQDAYCRQLEELIDEKIQVLSALKEKARNFLECQIDEEVMSRKLFMHKN